MSLQNDGFTILITLAAALSDNDIQFFILDNLQISVFCKFYKIITDLLQITRTMGNLSDFFKKAEHLFRFQLFQYCHSGSFP